MYFLFSAIGSRHLLNIQCHVCVWIGPFVDRWWLKEVWYAPDRLSNCITRVSVAAPGITSSPSKRICCGTFSQKTRNWPTYDGMPVHVLVLERSREGLHCQQLDSVGVLLRKQDVLMLEVMVNLVVLSPHSQRSTCRDADAVPSILCRYDVKPQKTTRSLRSFTKKTNEEVSNCYHASKYWFSETFTRFFKASC